MALAVFFFLAYSIYRKKNMLLKTAFFWEKKKIYIYIYLVFTRDDKNTFACFLQSWVKQIIARGIKGQHRLQGPALRACLDFVKPRLFKFNASILHVLRFIIAQSNCQTGDFLALKKCTRCTESGEIKTSPPGHFIRPHAVTLDTIPPVQHTAVHSLYCQIIWECEMCWFRNWTN